MARIVGKFSPEYSVDFERVFETKLKKAKNLIEEEGDVKYNPGL